MAPKPEKHTPTGLPPASDLTPDEVVAANIRHFRENQRLSRVVLAQKISALTGEHWSEWRLIDLEGARSSDTPPRQSRWKDLVSLALALDITVFELVLPRNEYAHIKLSERSWQLVDEPTEETSAKISQTMALDADGYSRLLFRLPIVALTSERIESFGVQSEYEHSAEALENGHAEMIEFAEELTEKIRNQWPVGEPPRTVEEDA